MLVYFIHFGMTYPSVASMSVNDDLALYAVIGSISSLRQYTHFRICVSLTWFLDSRTLFSVLEYKGRDIRLHSHWALYA